MCRILALAGPRPFDVTPWLRAFADHCHDSREYQGDGWGLVWRTGEGWERHRSLDPIWSDVRDVGSDGGYPLATAFLIHARSAFEDGPLALELNMPFLAGDWAFAFNGELRGVRLSVPGANGAHRLHTLFQRFRHGRENHARAALSRLDQVVTRRTRYVRALNVVVADPDGIHVTSRFSEDPAYFTVHVSEDGRGPSGEAVAAACSEALDVPGAAIPWRPMESGSNVTLSPTSPCSS